jgi:hypothetical protein
MIDDGFEISTRFFKNAKLFVGRGTAFEDGVDVLDLLSRAERIDYLINKFEKLSDQVFDGYFLLLA